MEQKSFSYDGLTETGDGQEMLPGGIVNLHPNVHEETDRGNQWYGMQRQTVSLPPYQV